MRLHVVWAIFKRNFVAYFSNPSGYVFILFFMAACSGAAFCTPEFFNANLANLDQLSSALPYILLVFVPAITMSIWAEERKAGTDELLLTMPATDLDVVLGKYLAATAIYSVALLFSMVCNLLVLWLLLGDPDVGLFLGTYFGYWIVGLAMLAIGMVASFLTGNLTVAFVLGVLLNAPLVFFSVVFPESFGLVKRWGVADQFQDFSRGVIGLASVSYFLTLAAVGLYVCMVLIGRRHWRGEEPGMPQSMHYVIRAAALVAVVAGVNAFLSRHDPIRLDSTSERLNSLSPKTVELLSKLDAKRPVQINAYVSRDVPESYVQAKLNLLSALREIQAAGGSKVNVRTHVIEPLSDEAKLADQQYEIKPQTVRFLRNGAADRQDILMGLAFECGLEKLVVKFLDKGIPAEYELARSIATVAQQQRKKVGVLTTDARLFGGFDMGPMGNPTGSSTEPIIEELKKQYDVVQVDPANPITEKYDVLLAVQPSSLGPAQLGHFVAAVKSGQATAIFEDPLPLLVGNVAGTAAAKQPAGGMFGMGQPPQPKGNINSLWQTLGIDFKGADVVWQDYNPFPRINMYITKQWVFVGKSMPGGEPFNEREAITNKLQQLLFLGPGGITKLNQSSLDFTKLITTGTNTGEVDASRVFDVTPFGTRPNPEVFQFEKPTGEQYTLAARIKGKVKPDAAMSDKSAEPADQQPGADQPADKAAKDQPAKDQPSGAAPAKDGAGQGATELPSAAKKDPFAKAKPSGAAATGDGAEPDNHRHAPGEAQDHGAPSKAAPKAPGTKQDAELNVILVADIDCLFRAFFELRARGGDEENFDLVLDNVTFVLNVLDELADEPRFIDIRNRRREHHSLKRLEGATSIAREEANAARETAVKKFRKDEEREQKLVQDEVEKLRNNQKLSEEQKQAELLILERELNRRRETNLARAKQQLNLDIEASERALAVDIRKTQDMFKAVAIGVPMLPPLILGAFVFFNRRSREREGIELARRRK